jgi:Flp pilus assembly secretin CpaC
MCGHQQHSETMNFSIYHFVRRSAPVLLVCLMFFPLAIGTVQAQDRPPQRVMRTYVPPDQIVSFLPNTPFDQFVEFINPIFKRVLGKEVIEPEGRSSGIGVSIAGMHFFDAFDLVLQQHGLVYRETDRYFMVQQATAQQFASGAGAQPGRGGLAQAGQREGPANIHTREVQISAILFEVNVSRAREIGVNWQALFGTRSGTGGAGQSGFALKTEDLFSPLSEYMVAPGQLDFTTLLEMFRFMETNGIGETVANPSVTVQSGNKGRIQIGSDVPVQTRDFSGNTITQFFSTGIIIDVTPTLISEPLSDTLGAALLDFIHLDIGVEKSGSRPSTAGVVIDRNKADTRVVLLNGEQTVIGGLYSTEEIQNRRGIPGLKDLPGWFFGLRYVFGFTERIVAQKELVIVLQANLVDPLTERANNPFRQNLIDERRQQMERELQRVDETRTISRPR